MTQMRRFLILIIFLLMVSFLQGGEKKIQFELYGGYSLLDPVDLNAQAEYDETYLRFYTEDKYSYYHSQAGDFYTYSGGAEGEFKKIKNALPVGFRIKYALNRSLWISLGLKYLSKTENSQVSGQYITRSLNPDAVTFFAAENMTREYSPYTLSFEGYAPMVGVHYKIRSGRRVNLEGYAAAGMLFASCDFSKQYYYDDLDNYGFRYEQRQTFEIAGKGTGLVMEAGVRVNLNIIKNIDLFMEGVYAYQKVNSISGAGRLEYTYNDSYADGYTTVTEWDGKWAVITGSDNRDWGIMDYRFPSNQYGTQGHSAFNLDLSGFQVRAGVSFRL